MADFAFRASGRYLLRSTDGKRWELLTSRGWRACSAQLARSLLRRAARRGKDKPVAEAEIERRRRRACCPVAAGGPSAPAWWSRLAFGQVRWILSPPLRHGAPRLGVDGDDGEASFRESLGDQLDELAADADAGYQHARDRRTGVEDRASRLLQVTGVLFSLVLGNSVLLVGNDSVNRAAGPLVVAGVAVAYLGLLVCCLYCVAATLWTFDRIAPHNPKRTIRRSLEKTKEDAVAARVASLLLAQRRTSLVADWKLARLKRATAAFLVATGGIAVASAALLANL